MQQNNIVANYRIISMHVLLCHLSLQEKVNNIFLAQEQKYLENTFKKLFLYLKKYFMYTLPQEQNKTKQKRQVTEMPRRSISK